MVYWCEVECYGEREKGDVFGELAALVLDVVKFDCIQDHLDSVGIACYVLDEPTSGRYILIRHNIIRPTLKHMEHFACASIQQVAPVAETHISDPSHYGSFNILNLSTFVKITAKLYGTTYKGDGMESISEYRKYYPPPERGDKYLDGMLMFLETGSIFPTREKKKKKVYLDDDAFDICDGNYAVEAALEVGFVATSNETKVFGRVMAYYGKNFSYDCCASERYLYNAMLFEIKQPSHIEPGKINLMRSALGVPAQYSLIIDAKLHDFTSGDMILSGVWEFFVPVDGSSSVGFINGNDCSLKLKVDWKLPI
ncbi:hypothetical protein Tco_0059978 [Tanacetum coccineum]